MTGLAREAEGYWGVRRCFWGRGVAVVAISVPKHTRVEEKGDGDADHYHALLEVIGYDVLTKEVVGDGDGHAWREPEA